MTGLNLAKLTGATDVVSVGKGFDGQGFQAKDLTTFRKDHPKMYQLLNLLGLACTVEGKTILLDSTTNRNAKAFLQHNKVDIPRGGFVATALKNFQSKRLASDVIGDINMPVSLFEAVLQKISKLDRQKLVDLEFKFDIKDGNITVSHEDFIAALKEMGITIKATDPRYKGLADELKKQVESMDVSVVHKRKASEKFAARPTPRPAVGRLPDAKVREEFKDVSDVEKKKIERREKLEAREKVSEHKAPRITDEEATAGAKAKKGFWDKPTTAEFEAKKAAFDEKHPPVHHKRTQSQMLHKEVVDIETDPKLAEFRLRVQIRQGVNKLIDAAYAIKDDKGASVLTNSLGIWQGEKSEENRWIQEKHAEINKEMEEAFDKGVSTGAPLGPNYLNELIFGEENASRPDSMGIAGLIKHGFKQVRLQVPPEIKDQIKALKGLVSQYSELRSKE